MKKYYLKYYMIMVIKLAQLENGIWEISRNIGLTPVVSTIGLGLQEVPEIIGVITSYSIQYTKLYERVFPLPVGPISSTLDF